ncbi:hypothetical protein ACJRO7_026950 [Eucalyptus globulus]|uniref:Uncharacterized protein n=1 Tax=Eucalyptus globulus TaxID=34317 RepID=A0ABD3JZV2_EUCGL
MDFATTTTDNEAENRVIVLRQQQEDPNMPESRESRGESSVDGKDASAESSYIVCEECAAETERGEGPSAFHCCPCDSEVVEFRTAAGPVCRPSPEKSN